MFPRATRAALGGPPVTNSAGALTAQTFVVGNGWNDIISLPQLAYAPATRTLLSVDNAALAAGLFEYPGWTSNVTFQSKGIGSEGRSALDTWVESGGAGSVLCGYFGGYYDRGTAAFGANIAVGLSGYNYLTATNARSIGSLYSGQFTTELSCANTTITTAKGIEAQAAINYGGAGSGNTIATTYAGHFLDNGVGAGATITTAYGVKVENIATGTANNWSMKTGTGRHEFGDKVVVVEGLGTDILPAATAGLEVLDVATLAAESLTNGALTSGTSWTVTGDMTLSSNRANYTHATGVGTLNQASGTLALPGVVSRLYKLVYTVSLKTGATHAATLTSAFGLAAVTLDLSANATRTVYFRSAVAPGNFVISVVSTTTGVFALDTLSLKEVTGGSVLINNLASIGGVADASAVLTVTSTTKGILLPRMTTTQRDAIASPTAGLHLFDSTLNKPVFRSSAYWEHPMTRSDVLAAATLPAFY